MSFVPQFHKLCHNKEYDFALPVRSYKVKIHKFLRALITSKIHVGATSNNSKGNVIQGPKEG